MKTRMIKFSSMAICSATFVGISGVLFVHSAETIARTTTACGLFGLASVGFFLLGLISKD